MHPGPVYLSLIGWKLNKKWPLINCIDGFIYFLLPNRFMLFLLNLKKVQKVASPVRIFDKTKTPSSNPMPSRSIFFKQFNNGRRLSYLSVLKILVYKCVFGLIQKLKILLVAAKVRSKQNIGGLVWLCQGDLSEIGMSETPKILHRYFLSCRSLKCVNSKSKKNCFGVSVISVSTVSFASHSYRPRSVRVFWYFSTKNFIKIFSV